jgi:UDP-GlcNAc:undecaprenyl-phosphate GlcNAc-1-phosphate transferase
MGDAGSLFLGYFLSVALLVPAREPSWGVVEIAVPLVILGVPIADTAVAIARRILRNRGVFSPDRRHLHHRLLMLGMSQRQAVLTIYGLSAVLAIAAVALGFGDARVDLVICAAVLAVAVATFRMLGPFDLRIDVVRSERRRNAELRASVTKLTTRLERVHRIDEVFDSIHQLAPAVAASAVRARIGSVSYEHSPTAFSGRSFEARFPLTEGPRVVGDIVVVWGDGRQGVDEDQALAIEQICDSAARAILRVSPDVLEHGAANDLPAVTRSAAG